jgi:ferric-dicitrate binding protein FerR (iron transport regulator)
MKSRAHILLNKFLKGKSTREEENILEEFEKRQLNKNERTIFSSNSEKQHIEEKIFANIAASTFNKSKRGWLQIAASVAIIVGLGLAYYQLNVEVKTFEVCNVTSGVKTIYLSDGSEIVLNSGSSIKYTEDFNDEDRQVELVGEAFFDVERNEDKPFIITTGKLKTRVLGTSFNINSTNSAVYVTVSSGLVQVYDEYNIIRIKPNQEAIYYTKTNDLSKRNVKSELITAWFAESVELTNVSMSEFSELMHKRYGVELLFSDANLANKHLTITIEKSDSVKSIINRINEIKELKLETLNDDTIEVKRYE